MDLIDLSWLIIAIPLLSAGILLVGGKATNSWGHWLGVLASAASGLLSIGLLFTLVGMDAGARREIVHLYDWITTESLNVSAGLLIDPLSVAFMLLITFVGTLIHIYSVAYMENDPDRRRFFAYLNLFIAAMLILVMADSYALLFLGWEGVGLASYLLIGFWNQKMEFAVAAKKAFVMNRVGDMGMLVAMMVMFAAFGSVNYETVFNAAPGTNESVLTFAGIALLVGATGKSAQFPLQAWLGDAMAGPTPVSALIHAATMVTAGVYLIVRSGVIFEGAPTAQLVVVIVGAITLLWGAIVGSAKDDIKKALAASTMSQIGYMMLAAGLGPIGYAFAIFHLVTHGFFKAGLFLGAGSVMHGMNDEVNMRMFGNLGKYMKITWITFGLGWLAIIGFPGLSGFWSKDKIIEAAFTGEGWHPWVFGTVALVGAGITAFYMSRLFFMTFHGSERFNDGSNEGAGQVQQPHESPALMTVPMIILAAGSVGLGALLALGDTFTTWLEPAIGATPHPDPVLSIPVITSLTLVLVAAGIFIAWRQYVAAAVPVLAPTGSVLTRAARADLYQDTINESLFAHPGTRLTLNLTGTDRGAIDGAIHGIARGTAKLGEGLRLTQNGQVRSYGATMAIGTVLALVVALIARF